MDIREQLASGVSPIQIKKELRSRGIGVIEANRMVRKAMVEVFEPPTIEEAKAQVEQCIQRLEEIAATAPKIRDQIYAQRSAAALRIQSR